MYMVGLDWIELDLDWYGKEECMDGEVERGSVYLQIGCRVERQCWYITIVRYTGCYITLCESINRAFVNVTSFVPVFY